jgi:nicotinate dehydrogenase subunit B
MKRRDFLKGSGLIIASFSLSGLPEPAAAAQTTGPYLTTGPDPRELDSFIAVAQDGTVTLYLGKTDNGQGTGTALKQMMADELDVAYEKTRVVMGDTLRTVDQGGMSFSTSVVMAGAAVRNASAEGRRVLLEMASRKLAVPGTSATEN